MFNLVHHILDFRHEKGFVIDRPGGNDMYTILLFKQPLTLWQNGELVDLVVGVEGSKHGFLLLRCHTNGLKSNVFFSCRFYASQ